MANFDAVPKSVEDNARGVVSAAFEVHSTLGPGLMESVYETAMVAELSERGIPFERQVVVPVRYKSMVIQAGLRLDIWVDKSLIIELKAVERLLGVHHAQLLTYLKLTGNRLGILFNFNTQRMKEGIKRIVL